MARAYEGGSRRLPESITFRPISDADLPFLNALYASTREDELRMVDWPEPQKVAFLDMQFEAQHQYYHEQFPRAEFMVVERDGKAIGRIYLDRRPDEIRLIDIALIPEVRNQGLGEALLRELLDEAQEAALPVGIHVEQFNPAMRLYLRLGFEPVEDQGVYKLLKWQPAPDPG